jgi:hypothetical protein
LFQPGVIIAGDDPDEVFKIPAVVGANLGV